MKYLVCLGCIVLGFVSCQKVIEETSTNEDGVLMHLEPQWQTPLRDLNHEHRGISSNRDCVVNNDKVHTFEIVGDYENHLIQLDIETGHKDWIFTDYFKTHHFNDLDRSIIHQSCLIKQIGSYSYCIDLASGETKWRHERDYRFNRTVTANDEYFYLFGPKFPDTLDHFDEADGIWRGNMTTGDIEPFVTPKYPQIFQHNSGILGRIAQIKMIDGSEVNAQNGRRSKENDDLLCVHYTIPDENFHMHSFLGLYNASRNEWLYDSIKLIPHSHRTVQDDMIIDGDYVYSAVHTVLMCHNLWTGEEIWQTNFNHHFPSSGISIIDDYIVGSTLDNVFHVVDKKSGQEVFEYETTHYTSKPVGINGIVYFASIEYLAAFDLESGKYVWQLKVPEGDVFKGSDVFVAPGVNGNKGKIIACTYSKAYCFEAYR